MSHPFRTLRYALIGLLLASGPGAAIDHMGMIQHYGDAVVNSYGTQLRNAAARSSMHAATGKVYTNTPRPSWPRHITDANALSRDYTVAEIGLIRSSDPDRARRLLNRKRIAVIGRVKEHRIHGRDASIYSLVNPDNPPGHSITVQSRMPDSVHDGMMLRVEGTADMGLLGSTSLKSPRVVGSPGRSTASASRSRPPAANNTPAPRNSNSNNASAPLNVRAVNSTPNPAAARFTPSESGKKTAHQLVTRTFASSLTVSQDEYMRMLGSGQMQGVLTRDYQKHGLNPNNLADLYAGALLLNWQIANQAPDPNQRRVTAVRDDVRNAFARAAWVSQLDNEQKQILGEILLLGTGTIASQYANAQAQGNQRGMDAARKNARDLVRQLAGFDPTRVQLTDSGFR